MEKERKRESSDNPIGLKKPKMEILESKKENSENECPASGSLPTPTFSMLKDISPDSSSKTVELEKTPGRVSTRKSRRRSVRHNNNPINLSFALANADDN